MYIYFLIQAWTADITPADGWMDRRRALPASPAPLDGQRSRIDDDDDDLMAWPVHTHAALCDGHEETRRPMIPSSIHLFLTGLCLDLIRLQKWDF